MIAKEVKSKMGKWLTKALFIEYGKEGYTPTFTLKNEDIEVDGVLYPSLKRLYLEKAALPVEGEYDFAMEVFGSWECWENLTRSWHIKPDIDKWRQELEVKIRSQALKSMLNTALYEGSKGTAAAKYIAERGWEKRSPGRPSKEEVARERKIAAGISSEIADDAARIGVH